MGINNGLLNKTKVHIIYLKVIPIVFRVITRENWIEGTDHALKKK